jgi:hypothetical protein
MQCAKCGPITLFYYNMYKKCVMGFGRDKCVEPEVTVRNFRPATSQRPARINQRIAELRRDWSERRGNM